MAVQTGRSHKRITKHVAVELVRSDALQTPDAPHTKETAIAQNVSTRGMRVATEHAWRQGDRVLLTSSRGFRARARVVYCQRMKNNKFAVGLELLAPVGETFN
jgi:hypothetical protein